MIFRFHLLDDLLDLAFLINYESGSDGTHVLLAHEFFKCPGAIGIMHGFVNVGNEGEREVVFFDEFLVRFFTVFAHAEYHITLLLKQIIIVTKVAGFGGTARRIVLGVEVHDHLLASKV